MKSTLAWCAALSCLVLTGCQTTKPLYHYGSYQSNLYQHFNQEETGVPEQIEQLELTIQQAAKKQLNVAPGIYAHLGYLYLQVGQVDTGLTYLTKEKELYPESATFIDFLLKNAKAVKP